MQMAKEIIRLKKKSPQITKKNMEALLKASKHDDFSTDNLKVISHFLDKGHKFEEAYKLGKDVITRRINIVMSEKEHEELIEQCLELGITPRQGILSLVHGEKKIKPLTRLI